MNLSNLKISVRLWLAFGSTMLIMLLMVAISTTRLNTISEKNKQILDKNAIGVASALEISSIIQENGSRTIELFITPDPQARAKQYLAVDTNKKKIDSLMIKLGKLAETSKEKEALKALTNSSANFSATFAKVADLIELFEREEAVAMMEKTVFPALNAALTDIATVVTLQKNEMDENGTTIKNDISFSLKLMLIAGALATIISAAFAIWITRSITIPLNNAIEVAKRVADGDLTGKIEVTSRDETGELLSALADMNNSLVMTIGQVHLSAETISTASGEIAAGNLDLSSRTESQASSLEETASSMEELTSTVKQNADNARQANSLVISASDVAIKGGNVVGQVVTTMSSIKDSSRKIVDIISVIDGIAFQTNILALNAAVEAARAGEQGRGFAVVASEVRNLAQRSASAAKEIKSLIDDSVEKVDLGSKLVDQAGQTMDEIVTSVKHVADIMSEITAASQEQSAGIEQVNLAITQMDEMTQQNAALVEQAAAAAESMQEQAAALAQAIGVFKLDAGGRTPTAVVSKTARAPEARPATKAMAIKKLGNNKTASSNTSSATTSSDDWEEF
ncbi:MAG: methyl-accepting chemotaxis protein [Undibacterium sp.]|nr:methyl-accepting chemotaxis protein [Undibacterium sp.]